MLELLTFGWSEVIVTHMWRSIAVGHGLTVMLVLSLDLRRPVDLLIGTLILGYQGFQAGLTERKTNTTHGTMVVRVKDTPTSDDAYLERTQILRTK